MRALQFAQAVACRDKLAHCWLIWSILSRVMLIYESCTFFLHGHQFSSMPFTPKRSLLVAYSLDLDSQDPGIAIGVAGHLNSWSPMHTLWGPH
jgi:hypothetical protein